MQGKIFTATLVALLLGTLLAGSAFGADGQSMVITTSGPVRIPGHVLPAGQYELRLMPGNNMVAVSSADGSKSYGEFFVLAVTRNSAAAKAEVALKQTNPDGVSRLAAWFFPGQEDGYSLVYPAAKHNATLMAQGAGK